MPSPPALEFVDATRHRDGRLVLAGVSLAVEPGEQVALLGINGAGKSTMLALAAGVLAPDSGSVRVLGSDPIRQSEPLRRRVGWLPDPVPLYPELRVREQIAVSARLQGLSARAARAAAAAAIETIGIEALADRLCAQLSRGESQRVGLAQAIAHGPDVLLLDEPAAGLDPLQHARLGSLLASLRGTTAVLHATHHLSDAATADRIVMLDRGHVRRIATRVELPDADAIAGAFLAIALAGPTEVA
jgi:ABC-2 type transport system ATP-binding protein